MSVTSQPSSGDVRRERPGRGWTRYRGRLFVGGAAVVLAGGLLLTHHLAGYETTDDAQVDAHLYAISARIPGYVVAVRVNDNQYVRQGDVLVELDPADYQLAVARARAELANSDATARSLAVTVPITAASTSSQWASSVADVQSADSNILAATQQAVAAHAQLEEAEANDARVQADLRRYQPLAVKQEISAQMYAQAIAAARVSRASVAAARANEGAVSQAVQQAIERREQADASRRAAQAGLQQVASTRARAQAAEADVQQKRAVLEQAERNVGYTRILAPASGEVRKSVVVGMNVQAGQQLLTIVPVDDVWITANFKETQLRHIRPGRPVKITVDSNGRTYRAHVDSLAAAAGPVFSLLPPENATGNYVKVVQRYLVAFGWSCLAFALFYTTTRLDLLVSFDSMMWLSVTQRVGLAFLFVPISLVAYVGLPADANNSVAGIVNFMRNIGASVGTSLVTTLIARRSMFHQTILSGHTTAANPQFQHAVEALAGRLVQFGAAVHDAQVAAYAMVYRALQTQATALAYIDTYWVLAVGASVMCGVSLFLKKNLPGGNTVEGAL